MMAEPEPVYLRRVGEAIRFLCGTQSLDVSSELAGRCGLLAEILDDTDDNDGTVVPYSIDAIAAWKEFAEQEAGQASHLDYGVTVRALKVPLHYDPIVIDTLSLVKCESDGLRQLGPFAKMVTLRARFERVAGEHRYTLCLISIHCFVHIQQ